jgi:YgiT-type zinc finger domain-containing protein
MSNEHTYPCPECMVGTLTLGRSAYFSVRNGQPITVPDFPAWICDVCGRREYDTAALAELQAMLDTGNRPRQRPRRPRPGTGPLPPHAPGPSRRRP